MSLSRTVWLLPVTAMVCCLAMVPAARADFTGLQVDVLTFEGTMDWDPNFLVVEVSAVFDTESDFVIAVAGTPEFPLAIENSGPTGAWLNVSPGGSNLPPDCDFIPLVPQLVWDTRVTIGYDCFTDGAVNEPTLVPPGAFPTINVNPWPSALGDPASTNVGWVLTPDCILEEPPGAPGQNCLAGPDLRVQLLRFAIDTQGEPACISGTLGVIQYNQDLQVTNQAFEACLELPCMADADCDDGLFCNGMETCNTDTGECVPGMPVDCDDGVACTIDMCDEGADMCVNTPDDGACDDGLFCNGMETCDPVDGCQPGTPVDCDDGIDCTEDSCDEMNDQCVNDPNDGLCDDGVGCTDDVCNPDSGCEFIPNDANCDNGMFCDGMEICDPGLDCQPGTPVDCDDGIDCTDDSCDEMNDQCVNDPNDGLCDDGVGCTVDTCNPDSGCEFTPDDAACDNGMFCDGMEICDPGLDCQPGSPVDCNDGVGCTDDSCDEMNDQCVNDPNDANCDDGVACTIDTCDPMDDCQFDPDDAFCNDGIFCNGMEICDPALDCVDGPDPCMDPTPACDEDLDMCFECLVDGDCGENEICVEGVCELAAVLFELDIAIRKCPNRVKTFSQDGRLTAAIIGSSPDPNDPIRFINASTARLSLSAGECNDALAGTVLPKRAQFAKVAVPFPGDSSCPACGCHQLFKDEPVNITDLLLTFDEADVVDDLGLDAFEDGTILEVVVEGFLEDGTAFIAGPECIEIQSN